MSAHQVKLLAARVVLAVGLGAGGGARWLSTAGAQSYPPGPAVTAEEKVRQLEAQLDRAKKELADQRERERRLGVRPGESATARWQYDFEPVKDLGAREFVVMLAKREERGWDFAGQVTLQKEAVWAFRRPTGGGRLGPPAGGRGGPYGPAAPAAEAQPGANSAPPAAGTPPVNPTGPRPAGTQSAPGTGPVGPGKP